MDSTDNSSDIHRRIHERNAAQGPDLDIGSPGAGIRPAAAAPPSRSKSESSAPSTKEHFSEGLVPAQFKLPRDLVASLKLHSIQSGRSMSDIVLDCLTSESMVAKAWISTKKAA